MSNLPLGSRRGQLASRLALLAIALSPAAQAETYFVSPDALPGGDGLSWQTAVNQVADGVDRANSGDQVFVAEGVYHPDRGINRTLGDRNESFLFETNVQVYGGFKGFEMDPASRMGSAAATILSGDLLDNDLPGFLNRSENSWHVVRGGGVDSTAIFDGFTIQSGNANGSSVGDSFGGGIFNASSSSPTIRGCVVRDNQAAKSGGGIANRLFCIAVFEDCIVEDNYCAEDGGGCVDLGTTSPLGTTYKRTVFRRNRADRSGGGVFSVKLVSPTFEDCAFALNSAGSRGGGYFNSFSSRPLMVGCSFTGNKAGSGGAIYNDRMDYTVTGCTFEQNSATLYGGAIDGIGSLVFLGCTFVGNHADLEGGAIRCAELTASQAIVGCKFQGNTSGTSGGALHLISELSMEACTFSGNTCVGNGGAIWFNSPGRSASISQTSFVANSAGGRGGACQLLRAGVRTIDRCVFDTNEALSGGAIYHEEGTLLSTRNHFDANQATERGGAITLTNLIGGATLRKNEFTNNSCGVFGGALLITNGSSPLVQECSFRSNSSGNHGGAVCNLSSDGTTALSESRFEDCDFIENLAFGDGGALFNANSTGGGASRPVFLRCLWLSNEAIKSGGAGYSLAFPGTSNPVFTACDFIGNRAQNGGALYAGTILNVTGGTSLLEVQSSVFSGNDSASYGGAISVWNRAQGGASTEAFIGQCTFSGNFADLIGGAVFVRNTGFAGSALAEISNSILWGDTAGGSSVSGDELGTFGASAAVTSSIYQGGFIGTDVILADPFFLDPLGADGIAGTLDDDLRLQMLSPAVDRGNDSLIPLDSGDADGDGDVGEALGIDRYGRARSFDFPGVGGSAGPVDLGAYEAQDCDNNGMSDTLEILVGMVLDCDGNFVPDICSVAASSGGICTVDCALDCDTSGVPDACQEDCDDDGELDSCQLATAPRLDCNLDGIPDSCAGFFAGGSDCDQNGVVDLCDIAAGVPDCDGDGFPDPCSLLYGVADDCNGNAVPDLCEVAAGTALDCNADGVLDECQVPAPFSVLDCNGNGILDVCDLASGALVDLNLDGFPDSCFESAPAGSAGPATRANPLPGLQRIPR